MAETEVLHGPCGVRVELDPDQCFPKDPGAGTPVMVYGNKNQSATWDWAVNEGTYSGFADDSPIPKEALRWLEGEAAYVENWRAEAFAAAEKEGR